MESFDCKNENILARSTSLARRIRVDAIRMVHRSHASHIGSILSVADILAVLYSGVARVHPNDPYAINRDRIILSKGHAGVAVYAALAETGFFPVSELEKYYADGSCYSGHVSHKGVPGVELSTGSLGLGACMACGMALSAKIRRQRHHVFAILGDGETEEGAIWEMALFASHQKLSNLTVIVDHNHMQAMGFCDEQAGMDGLEAKWSSFGWNVISVSDGNDCAELIRAFLRRNPDKPNAIIAHTIKGKGVSFMENQLLWHYRDPQGEFFEKAMDELTEDCHA